ncbi:sulfatase-like hydrolase/transferase [Natrarchaeobius oligotrophus]|uniref:Arylsulfatase n=1 Tax=Natrarchaeobius chitinivorans TaxID=1679083 RepID=A0A3N6MNW1_NATCH|nr:sulfatase-like hydrolase/transferase [Natrarchaeobius chitinivorans]RQG96186.1 arylsulfatase [Natrarchaeobius chitinivorans]
MDVSSKDKPNILLIVLDSVRASNTTLHGHGNDTTPFLEEFATQSTVYEQARAPSIWSLPSHVSMFTGVEPHIHGVTTADQRLGQGHTIWEKLAANHGYSTGLFTSNVFLAEAPVGLRDVFETAKGRDEIVRYPEALTPNKAERGLSQFGYVKTCLKHDYPIKSIINGLERKGRGSLTNSRYLQRLIKQDHCGPHAENFKNWVETRSGPWAACINFMDAHSPYLPDDTYDEWGGSSLKSIQRSIDQIWDFPLEEEPWWKCEALEALYDGTIRQMDATLEGIIDRLKEIDQYENTHIVITGDHGEGFGEFCNTRSDVRYVAHGYGIGESLVHVPLLSKRPYQRAGELRCGLASLTSFYQVIQSTVDSDESSHSVTFEQDSMVVSSHGRESQLDKYLGSGTRYHGDAFAVYREEGDRIQKYTKWGSDESIITLAREKSAPAISVEMTNHGEVDRALEDGNQDGLNEVGTSSDDIDEDTKDRLKKLGYM